MINFKIAKAINKFFFYGWVIIFLGGLSLFFSSPGQTYFISTFINTYIEEFGYTSTNISIYYSIATVISGSFLVFMGRQVDIRGQRVMFIVAALMLASAAIFSSFITSIWMIFFSFIFLRYFGQGSLTLIPGSLIPQWFDKRKAFAISVMMIGSIFANMLVPAINVSLIDSIGWRQTWRFWAILLVFLFIPIMYVFVVNKPEDIKLSPDNKKIKEEDIEFELEQLEKESWTLKEAVRTKEFWMVSIISMIVPMISTGFTFHFFKMMETKEIAESSASFIIGLLAVPGFFMPLIAGLLIDRVKPKLIIFGALTVISLSLTYMLFINSPLAAAIFMIIYGIAIAIQTNTINVTYVTYFGRKYLGSIRGAATVFMVIGSSLGPIPFGLSYDLTNSFNSAIVAMITLTVIGVIMSLFIKKPEKVEL